MQKMIKSASKKAKVTDEHKAEAARLRRIWDSTSHPNQTEFGETYKIGNQSAVGQFLRGEAALSLKAAMGFALGLGCSIGDFSARLSKEADEIGRASGGVQVSIGSADWPFKSVSPGQYRALSEDAKNAVESMVRQLVKAKNTKQETPDTVSKAA